MVDARPLLSFPPPHPLQRSRTCRLLIVASCAACCAACWGVWGGLGISVVGAAESTEAKVPADVPLAISFDNLQAASQAWQKTECGKLLGGPAFLPLRQELEKRDQPAPLNLRPWFGFDWPELASVNGPAALVVVKTSPDRFGIAWIFLTAQDANAVTALLATGQKYWQTHGFASTKETPAGGSLVSFRPGNAGHDQRSPTFFTAGRIVGVADNRDAALALVTRWGKPGFASLANLADYQAAVQEGASALRPTDVRWWVRPLELWSLLRTTDTAARDTAARDTAARDTAARDTGTRKRDWLALMKRQGGDALRAAGGRIVWPTSDACEAEMRGLLFVDRPLAKGARLLDLQPGPAPSLPAWLDGQISGIAAWRWNMLVAISAFGQVFDEVNEEGENGEGLFEELLDGLRDDPEGPQVDLRKDVFAFLGPELQEITDNRGERTKENPEGGRSLVVIQCRDSQRVRKSLERFYEGDDLVSQERLAGNTAWTVGPGRSLLVEGESDSLVNIRAVTVTATEVIFASDPAILRERLTKKPAAAPDSDPRLVTWQKWRKSQEDAKSCFRSLVQMSSWAEGSYSTIRAGQSAGQTAGQTASQESFHTASLRFLLLGRDVPANFPLQKMPPFSEVKGSLSALGTVLGQASQGFDLTIGWFRILSPAK